MSVPERPWQTVLFRASVVPTVAVGALVAAGAGYLRGLDGVTGAALGVVLVVATFGSGLWVARRTAALHPLVTMTAAMSSYLFTITLLLLVLVVVRRTGVVDSDAVGISVLISVFVWLGTQVRAFLGLRLLYTEPGPGSGAPR